MMVTVRSPESGCNHSVGRGRETVGGGAGKATEQDMTKLKQKLHEGPLDLIGDVHGELAALQNLLTRLDVDTVSMTAARHVVFVGDLVDRWPDSVGVVELVARMMAAGIASAVLGNHELNLLRGEHKEGSGWIYGDEEVARTRHGPVPFHSRLASPQERDKVLHFLRSLPLVLARSDLQVVHACPSPQALAQLPEEGDAAELCDQHELRIQARLASSGLLSRAAAQRKEFADLKDLTREPTRHLDAVAECDDAEQNENPIKVLTSGHELAVAHGGHFPAGGQWRFVHRVEWWRDWTGPPTVFGHYWRDRRAQEGQDSFAVGERQGVYCVDFSVGRRFLERPRPAEQRFTHGLAALRWPERLIVFDDGERPTRRDTTPVVAWQTPVP